MTEQGKLFVLEGPDGVGKSTLAAMVVDAFRSAGLACEYFAFPGRDIGTLGHHIYRLHHDPAQYGVTTAVNPASLQLLHVAAHIDAIERVLLPTLRSGRSVVLDRFWWSTWVYGRYAGVEAGSLQAMLDVEFVHWQGILPAIVFLLNRSASEQDEEARRQRDDLSRLYGVLAQEQQQHHPLAIVENNEAVVATLAHLLRVMGQFEPRLLQCGHVSLVEEDVQVPGGSQKVKSLPTQGNGIATVVRTVPVRTPLPQRFSSLSPAKQTVVFDTYWRFAAERQQIYFRRLEGAPFPWTNDRILATYKFTNAYRASDRVSQYLIRHVIYRGDQSCDEVFFRILLFKIFNRIETWELLERHVGEVRAATYTFERYDAILTDAMDRGQTIFSAAYIMPSGHARLGYPKKHRNYLRILEQMLDDGVPSQITQMRSMRQVFELLRLYPMIGDFLAYQYTIDLNYSELTNFSENEFVIPGPGARDGIRKCFQTLGGLNEIDIIRLMAERQEEEFARLGLEFRSLWGRPLQLIDCQNLFCEVDKYARLAHPDIKGISDRKRIKQVYRTTPRPITYWYPPKWGINHLIQKESADDQRF